MIWCMWVCVILFLNEITRMREGGFSVCVWVFNCLMCTICFCEYAFENNRDVMHITKQIMYRKSRWFCCVLRANSVTALKTNENLGKYLIVVSVYFLFSARNNSVSLCLLVCLCVCISSVVFIWLYCCSASMVI